MQLKLTKLLNLTVSIDVAVFAGYKAVDISVLNAEGSIFRLVPKSVGAVFIVLTNLAKNFCVGRRILNSP